VCAWDLRYERGLPQDGRALAEWRVRGVRTNIPFLRNVIEHPSSSPARHHHVHQDTPELLQFRERFDRATKILQFIGDVSINGNPR
jgi:pyruvate carboxylase